MAGSRVVVAGASGLIGRALVRSLQLDGVEAVRLVRRASRASDEVEWLTPGASLDPRALEGAKAVVVLNGASVGRMPWTPKYRDALRRSRLQAVGAVADALRSLGADAPALLSGSAVGFYGSAPGRLLTESSPAGETFLARLCVEWEAEAMRAANSTRVALLRTSPVLHRDGVLKPLIALTRFGLGGPIGRGTQYWPWISLRDEVNAIKHVIEREIEGPVNLAAPTAATANDIGRALARRMHRPFLVPAPAWAMRLVLGRDAVDSLLTSDARVEPGVLTGSGFRFAHHTVEEAVASALA
ncbi:TIGR01777 family oxidoreductase [Ruicaihuangia caeni]|uniref:TIGR01777 family oxidoreductase n=1 Tax=Ruicaihuangia caeni TaxID=3042517 RepID=UPI00338DCE91